MIVTRTRSRKVLADCFRTYAEATSHLITPLVSASVMEAGRMLNDKAHGLIIAGTPDNIEGFLFYTSGVNLYFGRHAIQQAAFYTGATGIKAARMVWTLHEEMAKIGRELGCTLAISLCSHTDPESKMSTLLARRGWMHDGYLSVIDLRKK